MPASTTQIISATTIPTSNYSRLKKIDRVARSGQM